MQDKATRAKLDETQRLYDETKTLNAKLREQLDVIKDQNARYYEQLTEYKRKLDRSEQRQSQAKRGHNSTLSDTRTTSSVGLPTAMRVSRSDTATAEIDKFFSAKRRCVSFCSSGSAFL